MVNKVVNLNLNLNVNQSLHFQFIRVSSDAKALFNLLGQGS